LTHTGLFFAPGASLGTGISRARLAEDLGYDSLWIAQIADREATIVASAVAAATKTINIGTGVLPTYPRTPVVMAQTAASLDELSGGRFILGLGTSHKPTIEGWHNMKLERPLAHIRDYVTTVRGIINGEGSNTEMFPTAFAFSGFTPPRPDLPIYLACLSPKMARLAGEIADGAVLWMCAPGYIEKVVVPAIIEGRAKAGKTMDDFEIVSSVPVALTEDPKEGRESWRRVAFIYWNLPYYRAAIEGAGFQEALKTFDNVGPSGIPDEVVDRFAGIGDEAAVRKVLDSYRTAGVTIPALATLPSHEGSMDLDTTMRTLAPK
jgi:alkanesulfonate monooxygenase SsuD/methylene tetrahydromethanopterin reductase-like flavin-dependent oxidoreductase (luciferase family)